MTTLPQTVRSNLLPGYVLRLLISATLVLLLAIGYRAVMDLVRPNVPPPPPAAREWTTAEQITRLQERLRRSPEDADAYALLGLAWLQQVRESGDASGYLRADQALLAAYERKPDHTDVLVGLGMLALARHDFQAGLAWGEKALAQYPYKVEAIGVLVDAYVELGRYPEAVSAAQRMVDLKPGVASYTRASYLLELRGNTEAAIEAMSMATDVPVPGTEAHLWSLAQLGNLYFRSGDWQRAEQVYRAALSYKADYPYAQAGVAQVLAAQGKVDEAIELYRQVSDRLPLPSFLLPLGELYEQQGRKEEAAKIWALLRTIQTLNASAGMNVDLEMALFEVDWGDPVAGLALAERAYSLRPNIYAANALAWAHYRNGNLTEAQSYMREALRLGTQDALLHFHAGRIAFALHENSQALEHLQTALTINPGFSPRFSAEARSIVWQITNTEARYR